MSIQIKNKTHYDTLLRALEKGILLTINKQSDSFEGTETLIVEYSSVDKTYIELTSIKSNNTTYKIRRKNEDLVYSKVTNGNKKCNQKENNLNNTIIESIEIVGVE